MVSAILSLLALAATSASALKVTSPTSSDVWTVGDAQTVTWETVSSDQDTFNIYLSNMASYPSTTILLASDVSSSAGSADIDGSKLTTGTAFTINFTNGTETEQIYAQSVSQPYLLIYSLIFFFYFFGLRAFLSMRRGMVLLYIYILSRTWDIQKNNLHVISEGGGGEREIMGQSLLIMNESLSFRGKIEPVQHYRGHHLVFIFQFVCFFHGCLFYVFWYARHVHLVHGVYSVNGGGHLLLLLCRCQYHRRC